MRLAVVSGKGGVGKTTVTATLAYLLREEDIVLVDADVDAPNLALALGVEKPIERHDHLGAKVAFKKQEIYTNKNICPFGAIDEKGNVIEILCEGCGVCSKILPEVYGLKTVKNAEIFVYNWNGIPLITAELEPGRSGSGRLVSELLEIAGKFSKKNILIDSAAGSGCPVIASVRDADIAVLVIFPSVTAYHDAKRMIETLNFFSIPFYFVINGYDVNPHLSESIKKNLEKDGTFLGKIPFNKEFAKTYPVPVEKLAKYFLNLPF